MTALFLPEKKLITLYAGQGDGQKRGRFVVRYQSGNAAGTVEGQLMDDDSVVFRVLDGPGSIQPNAPIVPR